ncbi:helicase-related protein [Fibrobacter sp. UWB7]|uniref:helicase-related protein n=1 Tax=Fibrobacter sp. UWB7 TaxID=1896206 RepID=UPI0009FA7875|nr:helicase-related protein [Fibrobacter sp. UWB7]
MHELLYNKGKKMSNFQEYYKAREIVVDFLRKDLLGPVEDNEILTEMPTQYYITGKLYPLDSSNSVETDEELSSVDSVVENKFDEYDSSISLSNQIKPSSVGMTFTLKTGVKSFCVKGSFAFYKHYDYQEAEKSGFDLSKWSAEESKPKDLWRRESCSFSKNVCLDLKTRCQSIELDGSLELRVFLKRLSEKKEMIVTVALLNMNKACDNAVVDAEKIAFQPSIKIEALESESQKNIFTTVEQRAYLSTDHEILNLDLVYSDVKYYAQGHGCAVKWDLSAAEPAWICCEFIPDFNLKQMRAQSLDDEDFAEVFSMKFLADSSNKQNIIKYMNAFAEKYHKWIDALDVEHLEVDEKLKVEGRENKEKCYESYNRICNSIRNLEDDEKAFKAFVLANEAMFAQRKRSLQNQNKTVDEQKITWRPFQLAFILQELTSFIDPNSDDRKLADLLWFPTGGGKTEAYLGVAAFTIFLKKLRNPQSDGTLVIMRYTLRLLTIQQFERASTLICAMELIRQRHRDELGPNEISIGLWAGQGLTPNKIDDARSALIKMQSGEDPDRLKSNPVQIHVCPWCGTELDSADYSINEQRMNINCPNERCEYKNGLPIHLIDESIYNYTPTFLVATVDKFAQIPLNDAPKALFGLGNNRLTPELIIQDELHLISGPLGTMCGLYEAAIQQLCTKNDIPAKVIASTATIRNAANQIKALYGRDHSQFPPQGVSARDSFFAVESSEEQSPARLYLGVMGVGTTVATALIRINAVLWLATRYLQKEKFEDSVIDSFWTITDYFNSLRELGAAATQIIDDVYSRLWYLQKNKFSKYSADLEIDAPNYTELTSRKSSKELTTDIQINLKKSFSAKKDNKDVYDFLLATNMISVGVDVGRLGTMVVLSQPKTNAEYIQATSRVGRETPGLVIALYNMMRSRDRSHYEQFMQYHSAFYRYVEATSLTPFSDRARDRGLHALFVALCRYLEPSISENKKACRFSPSMPIVEKVKRIIHDIVLNVDAKEVDYVEEELSNIIEEWVYRISECNDLEYKNYQNDEQSLLKDDINIDDRFRTMGSMRSVDHESKVYLKR